MRTYFGILLFCWGFLLHAQNPNGYYNPANGKKKDALKTALYTIVRDHTVIDYGSVWSAFYTTDRKPDGSVWDMYSNTVRTFSNTSGMNREHSLPKSWWGGDVNAAYTDLNHLFPSDADANTAKLNYPLGVVGVAAFNNGVSKVGNNTYAGYAGTVFEPANQYKGDFARAYFYMVTCYQDFYNKWAYFYMIDGNTYPVLKPWAINMLMEWHRNDPVSEKEQARNEAIFKIQNNRNPFIDYPLLAEHIWGTKTDVAFAIDTQVQGAVLITPTNDTQLGFGTVLKGASSTKTLFVKGINLTGNYLTATLFGTNANMFKVSTTAIPVTQVNGTTGYSLTVTYQPTQTAESHTASIILYDGGINGSVQVNITGKCIDPSIVVAPTALDATNIAEQGFTANWTMVSQADSYTLDIYVNKNGTSELLLSQDEIITNSFVARNLSAGNDYSYVVKSVFSGLPSSPSNSIAVSVPTGIALSVGDEAISVACKNRTIEIWSSTKTIKNVTVVDINGLMVAQIKNGAGYVEITVPHSGIFIVDVDGAKAKVFAN